jgi:8-oxo-dGTP pyrophosphatase MutT (NUDIX family)
MYSSARKINTCASITIETIRERLEGTRPPHDPVAAARAGVGSGAPARLLDPNRPIRPAAVLVPIVDDPAGPEVLFTLRTPDLADHGGQVSFPGGSVEKGDADPAATALREAREEIELKADFVEIIGFLQPYLTVTGFAVTPVVGVVRAGFELRADPVEVAEIFTVPLRFFLGMNRFELCERLYRHGKRASYYTCEYRGRTIWGATARMLVDLLATLGYPPRLRKTGTADES